MIDGPLDSYSEFDIDFDKVVFLQLIEESMGNSGGMAIEAARTVTLTAVRRRNIPEERIHIN